MSRQIVINPFQSIKDGDMSGDLLSAETSVRSVDEMGIELSFTGSPVGVFTVEGTVSGNVWVTLAFQDPSGALVTSVPTAGAPHLISLIGYPYDKIRVRYTRTSGTGTLQCWVIGKKA